MGSSVQVGLCKATSDALMASGESRYHVYQKAMNVNVLWMDSSFDEPHGSESQDVQR